MAHAVMLFRLCSVARTELGKGGAAAHPNILSALQISERQADKWASKHKKVENKGDDEKTENDEEEISGYYESEEQKEGHDEEEESDEDEESEEEKEGDDEEEEESEEEEEEESEEGESLDEEEESEADEKSYQHPWEAMFDGGCETPRSQSLRRMLPGDV